MCKLQKQYDFYHRNNSALMEEHPNLYLVISDTLEVKAFASIAEAYKYGAKNLGLGTFMIQQCSENSDKVQTIKNAGLRSDE